MTEEFSPAASHDETTGAKIMIEEETKSLYGFAEDEAQTEHKLKEALIEERPSLNPGQMFIGDFIYKEKIAVETMIQQLERELFRS